MTLQDVIDKLSGAELSNIFDFDTESGGVTEASRLKLLPQLNLGLVLLHKRFFLKENSEVINLQEDVYTYPLQSKDILRIETVKDLNDNEYLLDRENDPLSPVRKNLTTLKLHKDFMAETEATALEVGYRAGPTRLTEHHAYMEPAYVEVDLPYQFLEPLAYFIASQFLNPMGATDGLHEGNNYAAKYEQACQKLEFQNFDLDREANGDQFHAAGWV